MKKIGILFLILLSVFLITGCGSTKGGTGKKKSIFDTKKTMTCTKEEVDEDGYKSTSKYVITYTSKKVNKVESEEVMTMDPTIVDWVYSFSYSIIEEIDKLDGIDASYVKQDDSTLVMKIAADFDKINEEQVKEAFGSLNEDGEIYTKRNVTIDEFVSENMEGYTCK